MATTQTKGVGDIVAYETPLEYCRKRITVATSQTVKVGSPLDLNGGASSNAGVITSGNEANADAIALEAATTSGSTTTIMALVRGPCVVNASELVLETSVTLATVVTALLSAGIIARTQPTKLATYGTD